MSRSDTTIISANLSVSRLRLQIAESDKVGHPQMRRQRERVFDVRDPPPEEGRVHGQHQRAKAGPLGSTDEGLCHLTKSIRHILKHIKDSTFLANTFSGTPYGAPWQIKFGTILTILFLKNEVFFQSCSCRFCVHVVFFEDIHDLYVLSLFTSAVITIFSSSHPLLVGHLSVVVNVELEPLLCVRRRLCHLLDAASGDGAQDEDGPGLLRRPGGRALTLGVRHPLHCRRRDTDGQRYLKDIFGTY